MKDFSCSVVLVLTTVAPTDLLLLGVLLEGVSLPGPLTDFRFGVFLSPNCVSRSSDLLKCMSDSCVLRADRLGKEMSHVRQWKGFLPLEDVVDVDGDGIFRVQFFAKVFEGVQSVSASSSLFEEEGVPTTFGDAPMDFDFGVFSKGIFLGLAPLKTDLLLIGVVLGVFPPSLFKISVAFLFGVVLAGL